MTKNVCPRCSVITICLWTEVEIECPVCKTVYEVKSDRIDIEEDIGG